MALMLALMLALMHNILVGMSMRYTEQLMMQR